MILRILNPTSLRYTFYTSSDNIQDTEIWGFKKKRFDEHAAGFKHAAQKSTWPVTSMQVKSRRN